MPDDALARYAELLGASRVLTVEGAEHAFTRTHPRSTVAALLLALG